MTLHLLITYNAGVPIQSHAASLFTVQPPGRVVFTFLALNVQDPIRGSDIGNVVQALAFDPGLERHFRNELRTSLSNPGNARDTLIARLNNLAPVLGQQTTLQLRRKYFGDAATGARGLIDSV